MKKTHHTNEICVFNWVYLTCRAYLRIPESQFINIWKSSDRFQND